MSKNPSTGKIEIGSFLYGLHGRATYALLLFKWRWPFFVSLAGLVLSVALVIVEAQTFWVLLSIALTALEFVYGALNIARQNRDFTAIDLNKADALSAVKLPASYRDFIAVNFAGHYACVSDGVPAALRRANPAIQTAARKFQLTEQAQALLPLALHRTRSSRRSIPSRDAKVRLCSDLTADLALPGGKIVLQETDYYLGECTNELTGVRIDSQRFGLTLYDGFSFFRDENGALRSLAQSFCSNHIGVSTIAFTQDERLILLAQSEVSAQSANQFAPSGSGSVDWADLRAAAGSFTRLLQNATERELLEECGLPRSGVSSDLVRTRLIGYARLYNRGGKPEFFSVSYLNVPSEQLRFSARESAFASRIEDLAVNLRDPAELKKQLRDIHEHGRAGFSFILHLNFLALENFLDHDAASFAELIGG